MNQVKVDGEKAVQTPIRKGNFFSDVEQGWEGKYGTLQVYVLCEMLGNKYCCVNVATGNRWTDPQNSISEAVSDLRRLEKGSVVTVTVT